MSFSVFAFILSILAFILPILFNSTYIGTSTLRPSHADT